MRKLRVLILFPLLLTGCALLSHEAPNEDVDKAAGLFVQRLNAGDYEAIYKDTSKRFKDTQPKEAIFDTLKDLTAKGRLVNFQRIKMTFEPGNKDRIASPVYGVLFEQGRGDLTLNFIDESGEWKLIGIVFKTRT